MTFKQFNLHPMLRGEALSKILFIHKEIRRLYFSRLIEQICCSCKEEETISFHGTQRARHCLSLRPDHKNTQRDNIHNIDRTRKQRHALTRTCTPKCAPKHTHTSNYTCTLCQWRWCMSWGLLSCRAGWQALLSWWSFCFTSNKTPQLCIRLH